MVDVAYYAIQHPHFRAFKTTDQGPDTWTPRGINITLLGASSLGTGRVAEARFAGPLVDNMSDGCRLPGKLSRAGPGRNCSNFLMTKQVKLLPISIAND